MKNGASFEKRKNIIIGLALFLATLRGSVFWPFFAETSSLLSVAWIEVGLWALLSVLIFQKLRGDRAWNNFIDQWCKKKMLLSFLVVSFLSIFWSISIQASFYRTSILLCSTFAGAYIGYQYGLRRLLNILFWYSAIVVIMSFVFSLFAPWLSVMSNFPYFGAWRGIYWHRNHLGALVAFFNMVFLLRVFINYRNKSKLLLLDAIFYIISLVLIYFTRSAAGYIITLVMNFSVAVIVIWLRIASSLKKVHYLTILSMTLIGAILVFSNLGFIFGLFNREASLTGRIPMWGTLLETVVRGSPWIGYGFGAIWTISSFREGMQHAQGWAFPILIGDNGFLDILLHVGLLGLALFLGIWIKTWVYSIKRGIHQRTLLDFFPLFYMIFTLFANISFSLILETESFVWMVMVAILFALKKKNAQHELTS